MRVRVRTPLCLPMSILLEVDDEGKFQILDWELEGGTPVSHVEMILRHNDGAQQSVDAAIHAARKAKEIQR